MRDTIYRETIEHHGLTFDVRHVYDGDHGAPWEEHDGHGVVVPRRSLDVDDLHDTRYRRLSADWFYDQQASAARARAEGWGLPDDQIAQLAARLGHPPTAEEIRAEAVERDYRYLLGWCQDDWCYVGVAVTLQGTKIAESLWGVETSDTAYLQQTARELADEVIDRAIPEIEAEMARLNQIRASVGAIPPSERRA